MTQKNKKLDIILETADDKKAFDIEALDISKLTTITDYFVICSGNNERQVAGISDAIEDKMHEKGYELKHKEGNKSNRWVLLDFGDVVVHIFHKEDREFYSLERLWVDADKVDVDKYL